ncbi:MAG: hypothetical protein AAB388_01425 [Patescibacteria group bacterium]
MDFLDRLANAVTGNDFETPTSFPEIKSVDLAAEQLQIIGQMNDRERRLFSLVLQIFSEVKQLTKGDETITVGENRRRVKEASCLMDYVEHTQCLMYLAIQARLGKDGMMLLVDGNKIAISLKGDKDKASMMNLLDIGPRGVVIGL